MRSLGESIQRRQGLGAILRNIAWLLYERAFRAVLGLVVGVWLARYLGPERFGMLSFAQAVVALFAVLAGLGLQGVVVRDIVRSSQSGVLETLGTALVLRLVAGLLTYGLLALAVFTADPEATVTRLLTLIIGLTLLFKAGEVSADWFEAQVLSKYIVWAQNAVVLVFAALKALAILKHASVEVFAWLLAAEALCISLAMLTMLAYRGTGLRELGFTMRRAQQLLAASWPLMLSAFAVIIYMRIDQVMLGWLTGQASVGVYSAALKVCEAWYMLPVLIVASFFPSILQSRERSGAEYESRLQRLYDGLFVLTLGISLPIWLISDELMHFLFGAPYAGAASIVDIYIWNTCLVALGTARGKWLLAEDLQQYGVVFIVLSMIINVVANALLIPGFGGVGAAWATIMSTLVATVIGPALMSKTRKSSTMLLNSMNPWRLVRIYGPMAINFPARPDERKSN